MFDAVSITPAVLLITLIAGITTAQVMQSVETMLIVFEMSFVSEPL